MRINKGELIKKAREAESEALKLEGKGAVGKNFWLDEAKKLQPEIDALSRRADPLAVKFKDCYRRAREAFENDEKELAAQLKEDGYPYETECRALNGKANELRFYLDGLNKKYKSLYNKADELSRKSQQYKREAEKIRSTFVRKFADSFHYSDDDIENFLDSMPQKFFSRIESIEYIDQNRLLYDGLLGKTENNVPPKRATIEIFRHWDQKFIVRSITHEIGHVAYKQFLNDDDRFRFECLENEKRATGDFITKYVSDIKNAKVSMMESFCECFAEFKINPQKLCDYDQDIYNFVKEIYKKHE